MLELRQHLRLQLETQKLVLNRAFRSAERPFAFAAACAELVREGHLLTAYLVRPYPGQKKKAAPERSEAALVFKYKFTVRSQASGEQTES
jgi:hypothetical protein